MEAEAQPHCFRPTNHERPRGAPDYPGEMIMRTLRCFTVLAMVPLSLATAVFVQAQAAPSLQDLLKTQYKVTTTGSDAEGFKVIEAGTVLTLKKGGVIATPQAAPGQYRINPFQKMCSNTFKNGNLSTGRGCAMTTEGAHYLGKGSKLYLTKMEVKSKENKISFNLIECDTCNGAQAPSSMKSTVTFEFADKFLDTAEPGQIVDVINQVLEPDTSASTAAPQAAEPQPAVAQAPPPQAPAPAPAGPPPTVQIGDTPQQVIAILGNPIVVLPGANGKKIYKYKDFKVIFVGGKVAEVD